MPACPGASKKDSSGMRVSSNKTTVEPEFTCTASYLSFTTAQKKLRAAKRRPPDTVPKNRSEQNCFQPASSSCLCSIISCAYRHVLSLSSRRINVNSCIPLLTRQGTDYTGDWYCNVRRLGTWALITDHSEQLRPRWSRQLPYSNSTVQRRGTCQLARTAVVPAMLPTSCN